MTIGSQEDIYQRLVGYLPRWFGDDPPYLSALLQGIAYAMAFVYSLIQYAKLQTRISTATDGWLDLIANDFFGSTVIRAFGQVDDDFRNVILTNMFRERGTRKSVVDILTQLTGHAPTIIEPGRPADTGAYDLGGVAYDIAGAYGDLLTAQAFVIAYRPIGQGIPLIAGYDSSSGGYDMGSQAEYIDSTMYAGAAPDAAIYAAVNAVRPAGVTLWVQIQNWPPVVPAALPYYPPAFPIVPTPANAVITADGSFLVDSSGDYIVHA
jgi:hypothetical protein